MSCLFQLNIGDDAVLHPIRLAVTILEQVEVGGKPYYRVSWPGYPASLRTVRIPEGSLIPPAAGVEAMVR
jgi:hypothetical protein